MYIHHRLPCTPLDPAPQACQWNLLTPFLSCGGVGRARFAFYFSPSVLSSVKDSKRAQAQLQVFRRRIILSFWFLVFFVFSLSLSLSLSFFCLSWACCSVHENTVVAVDAQAARGFTWGGEVSLTADRQKA